MKIYRLKTSTLLTLLVTSALSTGVLAAEFVAVLADANAAHDQARRSQVRVDGITEETRKLLGEYKTVMKEVEGLRIFNANLERQISHQRQEMAVLNENIDKVALVERQVVPLMLRMIDSLDQFISLDVPFLLDERRDRIERLRTIMDRADVESSEKFSQVLNAYQIENEYGRTLEAYRDELELGGKTLSVDFLRMGRVALAYQTTDGERSGVWNSAERRWQELDASYNSGIRSGIRVALQQAAVDLITLPIPGAEVAR